MKTSRMGLNAEKRGLKWCKCSLITMVYIDKNSRG